MVLKLYASMSETKAKTMVLRDCIEFFPFSEYITVMEWFPEIQ